MKTKLLNLSLLFSFTWLTCSFQAVNESYEIKSAFQFGTLEDGWYTCKVAYSSSSSYIRSTYSLPVKVQYGQVVEIEFGSGGSVHSGYNNSGYTFSGGTISLEKDYSGKIIGGTSTVTIRENNGGSKRYEITF